MPQQMDRIIAVHIATPYIRNFVYTRYHAGKLIDAANVAGKFVCFSIVHGSNNHIIDSFRQRYAVIDYCRMYKLRFSGCFHRREIITALVSINFSVIILSNCSQDPLMEYRLLLQRYCILKKRVRINIIMGHLCQFITDYRYFFSKSHS